MNDSEVEDRLRRYRPIGPPAQLRERILATAPLQRIWPWATAAAVLLVSALTLRLAAGGEAASAEVRLGLGGDVGDLEAAEFMRIDQPVRTDASDGELR